MHLKTTLLATLLAVSALSAQAADWKIDPPRSTLSFAGRQSGAGFTGRFGTWGGQIAFDPAAPGDGKARIDIDLATARTGDPQKDGSLPGPDWFDTGKFPRAVFMATGFRATGGNQYVALGTLTLRAVSKPVELPFSLEISGNEARAKGQMTLIRSDYGVGQGAFASGDTVALDVTVSFDLIATRP